MTQDERERFYADIEKSHQMHRQVIARIAAGERIPPQDYEDLERFNEDLLKRTWQKIQGQ